MVRISKNTLNEWWRTQSFRDMEIIIGFRQSDFSPENGYQDFVDACDEWWNSLSYAGKLFIYNDYK